MAAMTPIIVTTITSSTRLNAVRLPRAARLDRVGVIATPETAYNTMGQPTKSSRVGVPMSIGARPRGLRLRVSGVCFRTLTVRGITRILVISYRLPVFLSWDKEDHDETGITCG